MAWQTIEQRISGPTRKPASMRLILRGDASLPSCVISVRKAFGEEITWKHGEPVGIQIGDGEHVGLVRVVRLKKGASNQIATVRRLNKGGMSFDFGHIPQLGAEEHQKRTTDARLIDADTIEVTVPSWNDSEIEDDGGDDDEEETPRAAPSTKPTPQAARAPARVNGVTVIESKGIKLDLTHGEESITFAKKTMDLTTRQAAVVGVLLRVTPSFVGRNFILNSALADVPQHTRDASLDLIVNDLTKALAGIGLQLKNQKGVGLALAING